MTIKHRLLFLTTGLVLLPQPALAHLVSTRFGEFYNGLLHPLTTLLHLLPWVAIALLCGIQRKEEYARWALVIFPCVTLIGALFGSHFAAPGWIQCINLTSLLIGAMVALAINLRPAAFIGLFATIGFSHGFANAEIGLRGLEILFYVSGVALAAYLLMTLLSAASKSLASQSTWGIVAVRAGGSWITAVGILYIGFVLMVPTGLE